MAVIYELPRKFIFQLKRKSFIYFYKLNKNQSKKNKSKIKLLK